MLMNLRIKGQMCVDKPHIHSHNKTLISEYNPEIQMLKEKKNPMLSTTSAPQNPKQRSIEKPR